MSASPTGTTYEIHIALEKFRAELRAAEQAAQQSAQKTAKDTKAAQAQAVPSAALDIGEAAGGGSSKAIDKAIEGANELHHTFNKVARVAVETELAIEAISVASSGVKLISAAIAGSYEDQVTAAKEAEETIKGIPVVGDKILAIGAVINKYTIDLVTHEQEYVAKVKEATALQEKHTAELAKQLIVRQQYVQQFGDFAKQQEADAKAASQTDEQKFQSDIAQRRARLKELQEDPRSKDAKGNLTPAAKSDIAEAQGAIGSLENQQAARQQEQAARDSAEAGAARARAAGNEKLAIEIEFEEQLRRAEVEAAKQGGNEVANVRDINDLKRKAHALQIAQQTADEENQIAQKQSQDDSARRDAQARADQQVAADLKAIHDREADEVKKTEDLTFEAHQRDLQTQGKSHEAALAQIEKETQAALDQAEKEGASAAQVAAIKENEASKLRALSSDQDAGIDARAISLGGSAALRTSFAGTNKPIEDLTAVQREAKQLLQSIADNTAKGAVAAA